MKRKISIIIMIMLITLSLIPINSFASTNEFLDFKMNPTVGAEASSDGFKDIKLKVTDDYGIKSVEIKEMDLNGENYKEAWFSNIEKKSEKEYVFYLSDSNLLKRQQKIFYIKVVNTKGYSFEGTFRVLIKSKDINNNKVNYYSVDFPARVQDFNIKDNNLTFWVRDTGMHNTIQVADYNNNQKVIEVIDDIEPNATKVSIDLTKFKTDKSGFYKMKVTATEKRNGYKLTSNYNFSFTLKKVATKPTKSSQLKLYKTTSGNSNPRYLKSPVTGKTEKVQSFAITDLGTSDETIWYAFQTYDNDKYLRTLINAYKNNKRVYSAALRYGGEGQGVDIDKIASNKYSIYCQGMSKKSIYQYKVSTNSSYQNQYDEYDLSKKGVKYNTSMEVSVDYLSGYAVATSSSKRVVKVYKLKDNYQETFSENNKINEFKIEHPSWVQGGDLCGKYYYYLYGAYASDKSTKTYICCYDVTTGKLQYKSEIALGNRVRELLNTSYKKLEPEGIKVYYYKGSYKIFIGFKVNDYRSAIFYFNT